MKRLRVWYSARRRVHLASLFAILALGLAACTIEHDYLWTPYEIEETRITTSAELRTGGPVSIVSSQSQDSRYHIGGLGPHEYYGTLAQLSESIVLQLSDELEKRDVTVEETAAKSIGVRVTNISIERGVWVIRANMNIVVEASNGYVIRRLIGNSTPYGVPRAVNGAIALAVIDILNDPKIVEYLSEPESGAS